MRNCVMVDYALYTTFACHNEPLYLLSRTCTDDYYGAAGPCCKVDDAINYLVNIRIELFAHTKFVLHCDDDMYWRVDQVLRWLAAVDKSGANEYPLIANLDPGDENNKGVWMIEGCKEVQTTGWYQPAMLNHALLRRMAAGTAAYAIKDTCKAFDVTHDIGLGVFAWMLGALHLQMPSTNSNGDHEGIGIFSPTDMAMHCVKHAEADRCDGRADNGWPRADRYKQSVVLGCGDMNHPVHGHDKKAIADMYDAWHYYRAHGKPVKIGQAGTNEFIESYVVVDANGVAIKQILKEKYKLNALDDGTFEPPASSADSAVGDGQRGQVELVNGSTYMLAPGEKIVLRTTPRLMPLRGYSTTEHSRKHNVTRNWVPFTLQDCSPPGVKGK